MNSQRQKIAVYFFLLGFGFLVGNLFGIWLKIPTLQFLVLGLIFLFEFFHFIYHFFIFRFAEKVFFLFYFLLRGFLLGIFVEAFKVGS